MRRDRLLIRSIQLGLFASVFLGWYFATQSGVRKILLPPPELVWREMQMLWASGGLWSAAVVTLNEIWQAYSIAVVAGIAVGFMVSRSRALVHIFEPVLTGMFAVPLTLFFPLFVVFFGIGPESKVAYAAAQCFFPIALNTIAGFANVEELYHRAAHRLLHLHCGSSWRRDAGCALRHWQIDRACRRAHGNRAALRLDRLRGHGLGHPQPARARGRAACRRGVMP